MHQRSVIKRQCSFCTQWQRAWITPHTHTLGRSSYGSMGSMEPPFREIDQLTQHRSRTRQNSGQLTYNFSGGSRGANLFSGVLSPSRISLSVTQSDLHLNAGPCSTWPSSEEEETACLWSSWRSRRYSMFSLMAEQNSSVWGSQRINVLWHDLKIP